MFFKLKSQSSSPTQVNEALDSFSELYHPRVAARLRQKINLCVQWTNNVSDTANVKNCFRDIGSFSCSESYTFPVFKTRTDKTFAITQMGCQRTKKLRFILMRRRRAWMRCRRSLRNLAGRFIWRRRGD